VVTDYHTAVLDLLRLNVGMNRAEAHGSHSDSNPATAGNRKNCCCDGAPEDGILGVSAPAVELQIQLLPPCAITTAAPGARVLIQRLTWGDEAEADAVKRLTAYSHDDDDDAALAASGDTAIDSNGTPDFDRVRIGAGNGGDDNTDETDDTSTCDVLPTTLATATPVSTPSSTTEVINHEAACLQAHIEAADLRKMQPGFTTPVPSSSSPCPQPFDLVIAADIIYSNHAVAPLYVTLRSLLRGAAPGARFLMAHTERRQLIPSSMAPSLVIGGGGFCVRAAEGCDEETPRRDEHLDLFLAKAASYGFDVAEVEFERRDGEELVHLFDVRLNPNTSSSGNTTLQAST